MSQRLGFKGCVTFLLSVVLSVVLVACGGTAGQSLDGLLGGGFASPAPTPAAPFQTLPTPNAGFNNTVGGQNPIFEEDFVELGAEGTFRQQCASCHGVDGKGVPVRGTGPLGPGACVIANCFDQRALSDYISDNMPRNAPVACSGSCADDMAGYILQEFANNRLDVVVPVFTPPEPQTPAAQRQYYDQFCASCHGANGGGGGGFGGRIGPGSCQRINCSDLDQVYSFNALTMPPGNAAGCVRECAMGVSQLIVGNFAARSANNIVDDKDAGDIVRQILESAVSFTVTNPETGEQIVLPGPSAEQEK